MGIFVANMVGAGGVVATRLGAVEGADRVSADVVDAGEVGVDGVDVSGVDAGGAPVVVG